MMIKKLFFLSGTENNTSCREFDCDRKCLAVSWLLKEYIETILISACVLQLTIKIDFLFSVAKLIICVVFYLAL